MILSIIILAGGRSERMGSMKQLLPWGRKTILQHLIDVAAAVKPAEMIVVLGYNAQQISEVIKSSPVKIVVNDEFKKGMSSSLKAAMKNISQQSDAYVFMLGDQPLVTADMLSQLLSRHASSSRGITVPVYKGIKGRPVVIAGKYREELMTLSGETGARQVIDNHPDDVLEVPVDSEEVVIDLDTQEEYKKYADKV